MFGVCFNASNGLILVQRDSPNLILAGLDGGLYHWYGTKLGQLPFTADDLVDHTHLHKGHGTFFTGAKMNEVVGINPLTGKVRHLLTLSSFQHNLTMISRKATISYLCLYTYIGRL